MKNILIAADVDRGATRLIDYAAQLAAKFQSKVWLLHIAAPDPDFVSMKVSSNYERDARADQLREERKYLQDMADDLREKGVEAEALLIQGPTVETLLDKATELEADLIITGMEEHGFLYNALIGSTAVKLLKQSDIPVLAVPLED